MNQLKIHRISFVFLLFLCTGLFTDFLTAQEEPKSYPVHLEGQTIFQIEKGIGSISAKVRAESISRKLLEIAKSPELNIEKFSLRQGKLGWDILYKGKILTTITDSDAENEASAQKLAQQKLNQIRTAVSEYGQGHTHQNLLLGILYSALATFGLILIISGLNVGVRKLSRLFRKWSGKYIKSIKIQNLEVVSAERLVGFLNGFLRIARIFLIAFLLYLYVPFVLNFFPWTRPLAPKLVASVLEPIQKVWHSFFSFLPNLSFIIFISVVLFYVIKFIRFLFGELEKGNVSIPGFFPEWVQPTYKIVRFLVITFGLVVIFPYLPGADSPAFKGISLFFGVLFSLGSTSAMSNIVAGIVLTYMRAFRLGDRVRIADTTGDIVDKTLLVTRIRTIKNEEITIPNSMVLSSHIINYSSQRQIILHTSVTIGYDVPWQTVHRLLLDAAYKTEHILDEPSAFVLQTSLDDFYVSYELNAYTSHANLMARIYSELHKNILNSFNEADVEIMSPHYSALRDGSLKAVPAEFLKPDESQNDGFLIREKQQNGSAHRGKAKRAKTVKKS